MYVPEPSVARDIDIGTLRVVLDEWSPMGDGFHIYFSSRRQLPTGLRLLIDLMRRYGPLEKLLRLAAISDPW